MPARYFLVVLRGIVLKGVGFGVLAPEFAALGVYAVRRPGAGVPAAGEGARLTCAGSVFLVRKEFQELRRNPRMFPVIFIAPVLQLGILGYAATTDVKNVPHRRRWTRTASPRAATSIGALRGLALLHARPT